MLRELFRKDFDGDFATELAVRGAVELAHAVSTNGGEYLAIT
jgi:hypothetical protein